MYGRFLIGNIFKLIIAEIVFIVYVLRVIMIIKDFFKVSEYIVLFFFFFGSILKGDMEVVSSDYSEEVHE